MSSKAPTKYDPEWPTKPEVVKAVVDTSLERTFKELHPLAFLISMGIVFVGSMIDRPIVVFFGCCIYAVFQLLLMLERQAAKPAELTPPEPKVYMLLQRPKTHVFAYVGEFHEVIEGGPGQLDAIVRRLRKSECACGCGSVEWWVCRYLYLISKDPLDWKPCPAPHPKAVLRPYVAECAHSWEPSLIHTESPVYICGKCQKTTQHPLSEN